MAGPNIRKPQGVSQETWDEKVSQEAKELYERGVDLLDISLQLDIPFERLNDWKFTQQWEIQSVAPIIPPSPSIQVDDAPLPAVVDDDDIVLSTVKANDKLLKGYKLVQQVAEEAILNDNIKFKDKKQASEALIDSLKGEVAVLGVDLSQQFLLDIAKIIKEEVTDAETLQRLGERLVTVGRLYNARINSQR